MRASRTSPIAFPVTTNRSARSKTSRVSRTLTSDLFDRIRLDILHGRLQPGSRLLFRDLRTTYGSGQSPLREALMRDRKSTRLNSSHLGISYAVFCLKKKKKRQVVVTT